MIMIIQLKKYETFLQLDSAKKEYVFIGVAMRASRGHNLKFNLMGYYVRLFVIEGAI